MIRTARIILAGLLHVLAAHIDVHDTYIVVRLDDEDTLNLTVEDTLLHHDAIVRAIDAQARMN